MWYYFCTETIGRKGVLLTSRKSFLFAIWVFGLCDATLILVVNFTMLFQDLIDITFCLFYLSLNREIENRRKLAEVGKHLKQIERSTIRLHQTDNK